VRGDERRCGAPRPPGQPPRARAAAASAAVSSITITAGQRKIRSSCCTARQHWRPGGRCRAAEAKDFEVLACDYAGLRTLASLQAAWSDDRGVRRASKRFTSLGPPSTARGGHQLDGRTDRLETPEAGPYSSVRRVPRRFWTTARTSLCKLSIGALGAPRGRRGPAVEALARTRTGRTELSGRTLGWPVRMPARTGRLDNGRPMWRRPPSAGALEEFATMFAERRRAGRGRAV